MASRILGMGDVISLVERAQQAFDAEQARKMEEKFRRARFNLEDFREQLQALKRMGPIDQLWAMIPGASQLRGLEVDEKDLVRIQAIIDSMTLQERKNPELFVVTSFEEIRDRKGRKKGRRAVSDYNLSRVRRVARGCGRKESEVKELLVKFATMRQFMMMLGAQQGLFGKIPGLKNIAQMKQLAGMDVEQVFKGIARFQNAAASPVPREEGGGKQKFSRSAKRSKIKRKRKQARQDRKRNKRKKK